jgi:ATP-dependent helicase HepA
MSEREPELGLGLVETVEPGRIGIHFPTAGERRLYARGTQVLKRVQFRVGDTVHTRQGQPFAIEGVEEHDGLIVYLGRQLRLREDEISDATSVSLPPQRLMAGQVDPGEVFDLRRRTLEAQARWRQSEVRGYLGGRLDLIPHQFYILDEVSTREIPRVLLADEVGLGKTIEACLIVQRLLSIGQARRVLVLVPETLVHQWFVELLRRFNLWFTIYDEERCSALAQSDPEINPFLSSQLGLSSIDWLAANETRREQVLAAGWDVVVVDEAHHLQWTPEETTPAYTLVEQLAQATPGLLLLTATPMQLGLTGHFARLRLLDPSRYQDYNTFLGENRRYIAVAAVAERLVEHQPLRPEDREVLTQLFHRDPGRLESHLQALESGRPDAAGALVRTLLDQHGTGRVVFRNTRATMTGFPGRRFCPARIAGATPTLLARVVRELEAEESGAADSIRHAFRDDPRIDWLADFLREHRDDKVLLICKSARKLAALASALEQKIKIKHGVFHEGLPLVQRDRNAAWFAEPDGAQLLLCSEIGSEGRNFQFSHHLVLFDLPLNPGLVEQRIGRLDRIGQTTTIHLHVPCLVGSADEAVMDWYHQGLDAFEKPLLGGNDYYETFRTRLLEVVGAFDGKQREPAPALAELIEETRRFRKALTEKLAAGRDRLLELNSFDATRAAQVIEKVRNADADPMFRLLLHELLDHFGVRVKEHELGELFLDPAHAFIEAFPSIPSEGMLATFDRRRAISREDIRFLSADHPLLRDSMELLLNSHAGTTSFGLIRGDKPNLLLETIFVVETVADTRWHVDRFLAPTPVRIVVDLHGQDLSSELPAHEIATHCDDSDIHRFLERPGFNVAVLKALLEGAEEQAQRVAQAIKQSAAELARQRLTDHWQRLVDLSRINDHVRPAEIEAARARLDQTMAAIADARLRLDSLRLIVQEVGD